MLIDAWLDFDASSIGAKAHDIESLGFDGVWVPEIGHDPLLVLSAAAPATKNLELGTGIVVAFGRSPMITAMMANDLQMMSHGRLLLGLGSQIKPHIEKRYSMPWSHPAPRMREYILAVRAIWASWNEGEQLFFRGEYYRHTLMTPFFSPSPHYFGPPKIFLAAVGELMTEVAGEVADGLLVHPFTTEKYLREVTLPALERGLERVGRDRSTFQISLSGMVAVEGAHMTRELLRKQVAFYASTAAYRCVLDVHGWGELQPELSIRSRAGQWDAMSELIEDDVLDAFCITAPIDELADQIWSRFENVIDRFNLYQNESLGVVEERKILDGLRALDRNEVPKEE